MSLFDFDWPSLALEVYYDYEYSANIRCVGVAASSKPVDSIGVVDKIIICVASTWDKNNSPDWAFWTFSNSQLLRVIIVYNQVITKKTFMIYL